MARQKTGTKGGSKRDNTSRVAAHFALTLENQHAENEGPRRKHWSIHDLKNIRAKNERQQAMCDAAYNHKSFVAKGCAGTGKTYFSLNLALNLLLDRSKGGQYEKIIIIRSAVASRDIGFLPGTVDEKIGVYEQPYRDIFHDIVGRASTYDDMKAAGKVEFMSSSFVRGLTWDNAIIVIDEAQNMTFSELDSCVTRLGTNSLLMICGDDLFQQDLKKEQTGFPEVIRLASYMQHHFSIIEFTQDDIVRSSFVRDWIITRSSRPKIHLNKVA